MKKIMLLFALMTNAFAQPVVPKTWGGGLVWADSLLGYHDSTGGSWYSASDSVSIIELNYVNGFPSGIAKDTGMTFTDTLKFYKGVLRFASSFPYTRTDTIWSSSALPIKIDAWTVDTILVLGGKIKHFQILDQNIMLLKVIRLATDGYGVGKGIKTDFIIEAIKW